MLVALLVGACGGDGGGRSPSATPLFFQPQETCDRDLAATPPDTTVFGADPGDYLADRFSLAAGDFNGDGRADVLVGAPLADGPGNSRENAGEAYIIFGGEPTPAQIDLAQGAAFRIIGAQPGDNLGFTVAAGDVNGDGIGDALVGARFADVGSNQDAGALYVVLGRRELPGVLDTSTDRADVTVAGTEPGGFFTIALAAGDVTGDGIDDMLVGASGSDGPDGQRRDAGEVRVIPGSAHLPTTLDAGSGAFFTVFGASASDSLPNDLAAGDIDGDGRDEIIIGSPFSDGRLRQDAGKVYIVPVPRKGGQTDLAAEGDYREMTGGSRKDALGFQVAIGDVNGDRYADVIAGARDADGPNDAMNNAGEVHVWLGGKQLPRSRDLADASSDSVIVGSNPGDSLGFSVTAADFNGDGLADILAGAPMADGCGDAATGAGDAYVVFGRDPLPRAFYLKDGGDLTFLGSHTDDGLGFSLATGDFNGDAVADVVLGAIQADGPDGQRPDAGEAYVVLGHR